MPKAYAPALEAIAHMFGDVSSCQYNAYRQATTCSGVGHNHEQLTSVDLQHCCAECVVALRPPACGDVILLSGRPCTDKQVTMCFAL